MPIVTIKSDNQKALSAIAQLAHVMQMDVTEVDEEGNEYYCWKEVKILKAKQPLDVKSLSGSFPNLGLDPETFRSKLWERNKEV